MIGVVLAALIFTTVFHALNHHLDRAHGRDASDPLPLLGAAALGAIALVVHRRATGSSEDLP